MDKTIGRIKKPVLVNIIYNLYNFTYGLINHRKIIKHLEQEAGKPFEIRLHEFSARNNMQNLSTNAILESPLFQVFGDMCYNIMESNKESAKNFVEISFTRRGNEYVIILRAPHGKKPSEIINEHEHELKHMAVIIKNLKETVSSLQGDLVLAKTRATQLEGEVTVLEKQQEEINEELELYKRIALERG